MNEAIRYTFFIFLVILVGTSCTPMRYLNEGETFLKKNKINIEDRRNVDDYSNLKYELSTKIYQKPNTKFLGMPTLGPWFYYRIQSKSDTSKWNRFVLRKWAEEPAVYNSNIADASAKNLEKYLQLRGYFDAHVDFETKKKGLRKKKMHVKYNITVGKRYYIDTLNFVSKDPAIHQILQEIKSNSF
ncbi:MAG TPA: hypothetical protein ENJ53_06860, partial [Phaeodactylibacter sp.]|nr:hypothetical protein [Phaeodactylibacter sp.]